MRTLAHFAWLVLLPTAPAFGQMPVFETSREIVVPAAGGWRGFVDAEFLAGFLLSLVLATVLGAVIGRQPATAPRGDSVEDVDAAKICILYAMVGAVIGTMVLKYGMVIGLVIFGIGGLFRFRTTLGSARTTGRVILATLIGLSSGLNLPHMAVGSAVFAFVLLHLLDRTATHRVLIKSLTHEAIPDAAVAYRRALERAGCNVLNEKKNFLKNQVSFVFRVKQGTQPDDLQHRFEDEIPDNLRGAVDWGAS